MNLETMHRTSEYNVKAWLREQYRSHGTDVPQFSTFDGTAYESSLAELGVEVFRYVEDKRHYVSTINVEW